MPARADGKHDSGITVSVRGPDGVAKCASPSGTWNGAGIVACAAAAAAGSHVLAGPNAVMRSTLDGWGAEWLPVPAVAAVIGATAAWLAASLLPDLGDDALFAAEDAILGTTECDWRHEWTSIRADDSDWNIHSVRFQLAGLERDADLHVVIVHGHSSGAALFHCLADPVIRGLAAPGVLESGGCAAIHLLDMPGWGRSPAPESFQAIRDPVSAVDSSVAMLHGWIAARGLTGSKRVVLLGHSIGGLVALHYATKHPEDLRQLILADPAGLVPSAPTGLGWTLVMRYCPPQLVARTAGRLVFGAFLFLYSVVFGENPRFPSYYFTLAYATTTRGRADVVWASAVEHERGWTGVHWRYPALTELLHADVPMSLLWGSSDALFPVAHAALVHRLRPDSDVYVIDAAGHNPAHNDLPATVAAVVDAVASFHSRRHRIGRTPDAGRGSAVLLPVPPAEGAVVSTPSGSRVRVSAMPGSLSALAHLPPLAEPLPASAPAAAPAPHNPRAPAPIGLAPSLRRRHTARAGWRRAMRAAGSGRCAGCGRAVRLQGHRFGCECGSWTFVSHASVGAHADSRRGLAEFLTSLYESCDFNARTARYLGPVGAPLPDGGGADSEDSSGSDEDVEEVVELDEIRPERGHVFLLTSAL